MSAQLDIAPAAPPQFEEVLEAYLARYAARTVQAYRRYYADVLRFAGIVNPADLTPVDCLKWYQHRLTMPGRPSRLRRDDTASPSTANAGVQYMHKLYHQFVLYGLLSSNPFETVYANRKRHTAGDKRPTEMIPFGLVGRLLQSIPIYTPPGLRDWCLVGLLVYCGLRIGEVEKLVISDYRPPINNTPPCVALFRQKNGQTSLQPVPPAAAENLAALVKQRQAEGAGPADPLFVRYAYGRPVNKPLKTDTLRAWFKRWCRKAGLPASITPHSARATAITKLLADGCSYRQVQEFSRHSSVQLVELYDKRRFSIEQNVGLKLKY